MSSATSTQKRMLKQLLIFLLDRSTLSNVVTNVDRLRMVSRALKGKLKEGFKGF